MIGSFLRFMSKSILILLILGFFVDKNYDADEYCRAKKAEHEILVCNTLRSLHFFYDRLFETLNGIKKRSLIVFDDARKEYGGHFKYAQQRVQEGYDYLIKQANNIFPTDVVYTIQMGLKQFWRGFQQFSLLVVRTTINISLEIFHFLENYVFIGHFTFENIQRSLSLISQMIARWVLKATEVIAGYVTKFNP